MTLKKKNFSPGILTICMAFFFAYVLLWVWLIYFSSANAPQSVELVNDIKKTIEVRKE
jgi:hypothetical protein